MDDDDGLILQLNEILKAAVGLGLSINEEGLLLLQVFPRLFRPNQTICKLQIASNQELFAQK